MRGAVAQSWVWAHPVMCILRQDIFSWLLQLYMGTWTSIVKELTCDRPASYPGGVPGLPSACTTGTRHKHQPYEPLGSGKNLAHAGVSNLWHCRMFVRQTGQNVRQAIFKYDPFFWQFEEKITEVLRNFSCREAKTVLFPQCASFDHDLLINTSCLSNHCLCLRDNYL